MVKVSKLKLMLCSMIIMASTGYSQSTWIGVSGGILHFQNPELFTKSISGEGLDFNWGVQLGIRAKYAFINIPLKLTGLFNYTKLKGKGSSFLIAPPMS